MKHTKKILITGGPGAGKTTLINELQVRNFNCEHEIVRSLTLEGKKNGSDQAFLENPLKFTKTLLDLRLNQFNKIQKREITFYDRGVHDTLAYLNYIKIEIDDNFIKECEKIKYDLVFVLPPWKEIYQQDNCRYEKFEESIKIYEEVNKIYNFFKMDTIILGKKSINNRINEILKYVKTKYV